MIARSVRGVSRTGDGCDSLNFALLAEIAAAYERPLATGENLYSTQDVENLVRFGGLRAGRDIIQVDPPQAYGIGQYASLDEIRWTAASASLPAISISPM